MQVGGAEAQCRELKVGPSGLPVERWNNHSSGLQVAHAEAIWPLARYLLIPPKCRGERQEEREYLETAGQHEERIEPQTTVAQRTP